MEKTSAEIKNYIDEILEKRKRGILDLDTCQDILERAAEWNSPAVFGVGYYSFAENYKSTSQLDKAIHCLTECTKCLAGTDMYDHLARSYNMLGAISEEQENTVVALNYFYLGLQYAEKHELLYVKGMLEYNIAYMLTKMGCLAEAAVRYELSLESYEKREKTNTCVRNMISCLTQLGGCYLALGSPEKSFAYFERVQELRRLYPNAPYADFNVLVLEVECTLAHGRVEEARRRLGDIMDYVRKETTLGNIVDCVIRVAIVMEKCEEWQMLEEYFELLDERGLDKSPSLDMNLYAFRRKHIQKNHEKEKDVYFTHRYFDDYEKERRNNVLMAAKLMELHDRIKKAESEREKIIESNQKLANLALYDSMTELPNRTYLNEYLSAKFEEAVRDAKTLGIEILDIDCFKQYNDTYGHLAGDEAIEAIAEILKSVAQENVFCTRYGGDEFMIVYSDMTINEISKVAESIQRRVRALNIEHSTSSCSNVVTVSQGLYVKIPDEDDREWDLKLGADVSLYEVKQQGRNRFRIDV